MKKPTVKDIAKIAHVSPMAVSMALNDRPRIGKETREKILRIAKELKYQPNFAAKSLVIKKSHTLGLILKSWEDPSHHGVIKGIEGRASELGYAVILSIMKKERGSVEDLIGLLRGKGADGVILASVEADADCFGSLSKDPFPIVMVNQKMEDERFSESVDFVAPDHFSVGYTAMEHLYKLGHRRIAVLLGSPDSWVAKERTRGAIRFLVDCGLGVDSSLMMNCNFSKDLAYDRTGRLLSLCRIPTAIFAESDDMALGSREALLEAGFKIPQNIALMGCDDVPAAALKGIELTTFRLEKYKMGSIAVDLLLERINKAGQSEMQQEILKPQLIIRNSCGYWRYGYTAGKETRAENLLLA